MKKFLSLLLLSALPAIATAQTDTQAAPNAAPSSNYDWFPVGRGFRPLVADPSEPHVFISRLNVKRDAGEFSAARAAIGYDFGVLRRQGERPDDGWQLSVFGSVDSLFNLNLPGDALVNTDYRLGLPLTWRRGAWSARGRLIHQSSHLGDELILGGNAPRRIELSFEAVDLLVAWERAGWRVYAGGNYVWRTSTDLYKGSGAHLGFDFVSSSGVLFGQRLTGGIDVKWLEQVDWRAGTSAKFGLMLGRYSPDRRGFTIFAEAYNGFAPFGQFFVEDVRYYGVTLQFDF